MLSMMPAPDGESKPHREPTAAQWRGRCKLAESIVRQRATTDGLDAGAVRDLLGALVGLWDQ